MWGTISLRPAPPAPAAVREARQKAQLSKWKFSCILQWSGRKLWWALGFRAKATPFTVKCFQCWWEVLLWHHWRLNYSIYPPLLGTVHRRKCRPGHQGKLHHAALPECHRHLETPGGQVVSPAPLPSRALASRVKSSVTSTFPEISGRAGCSKAFLWKSGFFPSPRGAMEANSWLFFQRHSDNNDVQSTVIVV